MSYSSIVYYYWAENVPDGEGNYWVKVKHNNDEGWVLDKFFEPLTRYVYKEDDYAIPAHDFAKLFSKPNLESEVLEKFNKDDIVYYYAWRGKTNAYVRLGVQYHWVQVKSNSKIGFVSDEFLRKKPAGGGDIVDMTGYLVPHADYSPTGKWTAQDLLDFKSFEDGNTLLWTGCTPKLMEAKEKFEAALTKKGWTWKYESAYRPLIYQAHFHDIVKGSRAGTAEGNKHIAIHKLGSVVAYPNPNAAHTKGIAFDAIIYDADGKQLNDFKYTTNDLVELALSCGLNNNLQDDYVDFRLPS